MISHITQKITRTAAFLVIVIIGAMALGACFQSVYPVEGTHHASMAQALLASQLQREILATWSSHHPLGSKQTNKAGSEEGRRGGSCSLRSAPSSSQGTPHSPPLSSAQD